VEIGWYVIYKAFMSIFLRLFMDLVDLNDFFELQPVTIANIYMGIEVAQYFYNCKGLIDIMIQDL